MTVHKPGNQKKAYMYENNENADQLVYQSMLNH